MGIRRRAGEQHVTVADGVQRPAAAEGAADLIAADGLAQVVNDDQGGLGYVAQPQQCLAESSHGARVIFILIVSGVERIQNNDLRGGGLGRGQKVVEPLGAAEEMTGGASIDEQVGIRCRT